MAGMCPCDQQNLIFWPRLYLLRASGPEDFCACAGDSWSARASVSVQPPGLAVRRGRFPGNVYLRFNAATILNPFPAINHSFEGVGILGPMRFLSN